ncbi:MAG: succinylglutamate desuccinylase/aspartoacylase family protein, partial [Pseudomonadota bacterium]|nr:succinylglutamate desuccinylase/aspartoacylase family protein [Pseudomonadota bacterium]
PQPVAPRPVLPPTPPVSAGPPVSAAIAARFPEPAVSFDTPAFEPGRTAYTTNDEVRAILRGLERGGVDSLKGSAVAVLPLGESQAGAPIDALAFTRAPPIAPPPPTPAASDAPSGIAAPMAPLHRPAVVIIAGQHGDEPAGTEALLVIAQELAAGRLDAVLDQVDVYLLPRVNPDGAALGQRGAADGSDVNRDHVLLRTPEAQAVAQLVRNVAPVVVLDLHEYPVDADFAARFGGVQRFDALLQAATVANMRPFVARAAEEWFRVPLVANLGTAGFSTEWYYTLAADPADRKVSMGGVEPGIGRNAEGLRNAVSLLVETRGRGIGRTDFKRRVDVDVVAVRSVLGNAAAHAADLVKLRQFVDRDVAAQACQGEAVIEAAPTPSEKSLAMLDAATGAIEHVTVTWDSSLELRVLKSRPRPCGYWLAASESDAVRRLRLLGVEVQQIDEGGEVRGETYRETSRTPVDANGDGSMRLGVQMAPVLLDVAPGSYYVSLEQAFANLAIAALEPESPAGYAAHGVIGSVAAEARVLDRPRMHMVALP